MKVAGPIIAIAAISWGGGTALAAPTMTVGDFLLNINKLESADFSVIFLQPVTFAHGRESTARIAGRVR